MTKVTKQNGHTLDNTGSFNEDQGIEAVPTEAPELGLGSRQFHPETGRLLSDIDHHGQQTFYDEEEIDPVWDFEGSDLFDLLETGEGVDD